MKITRRQLRRLIKEEMLGMRDAAKKQTISEGIMVSLKPISQINRAEESREEMWMRIAGITEASDEKTVKQNAIDKAADAIASAAGLPSGGLVRHHIKNELENEPLEFLVSLGTEMVTTQLLKWYEDNVAPDLKGY